MTQTALFGSTEFAGDCCPQCGYEYGHISQSHLPVFTLYEKAASTPVIVGFRCPACAFEYKGIKD